MSLKTNLIEPAPNGTKVSIPTLDTLTSGMTVTSIAALQAVEDQESDQAIYLSAGGRSGTFVWKLGDYSTEVAADTQQGIYVAASSDPTGLVGCWIRQFDGGVYPEWFGAVGDALEWDTTLNEWVENPAPTDDTVACAAAMISLTGLPIVFSKWFAIYPETSGTLITLQGDLTPKSHDGTIVDGFTYYVQESSPGGTVTYNGTVYSDGETFTGVFGHTGYDCTNAEPWLRCKVGLLFDANSFDNDYNRAPTFISQGGGLVGMESGAVVGVVGNPLNTSGGNKMNHRTRFDIDVVSHSSIRYPTADIASIGVLMNACVFRSDNPKINSDGFKIGLYTDECWNASFERLGFQGFGTTRVGWLAVNQNQTTLGHMFTLNFRMGGYVKFASAHGASVGSTVIACTNTSEHFTGEVSEVISPTEVYVSDLTNVEPSTVSIWTATVDGGSEIDIHEAYPIGGIGTLQSNPTGCRYFIDTQNRGEAGVVVVVNTPDRGPTGLHLDGHNEGPANGVVVRRSPFGDSSAYFSSLTSTLQGFAGRLDSGAKFGDHHLYDIDAVRGGNSLGPAFVSGKDYFRNHPNVADWSAGEAVTVGEIRAVRGRYYICTTAGTTDTSSSDDDERIGPETTGTGITDGTVVWDFLKYASTGILIREDAHGVDTGVNTYEQTYGNAKVVDMQYRPHKALGPMTLLDDIDAVQVISRSGITGTTSSRRIYVDTPINISSIPGVDFDDPRMPQAIIIKSTIDITTAGSSGIAQVNYKTPNNATDINRKHIVTAGMASNGDSFEQIITMPIDKNGRVDYQAAATSSVGWDVDLTVKIVGYHF